MKLFVVVIVALAVEKALAIIKVAADDAAVVAVIVVTIALLVAVRSLRTFLGGFLSSWKKYFLSTYGLVRPVPNGSKSVKASDQFGQKDKTHHK